MTETGMIRKIDILGRIVIPKEIRRNLKINSGDDLELYVDGESLILQKHEAMESVGELAKKYCDIIYDHIHTNCFICSRERVIAGYTRGGGEISRQLNSCILKGEDVNLKDRTRVIPLFQDEEETNYFSQSVVPVTCMGDVFGAIVAFNTKNEDYFEEKYFSFLKNAAVLLCGQVK